jgi:hypothetical protein
MYKILYLALSATKITDPGSPAIFQSIKSAKKFLKEDV